MTPAELLNETIEAHGGRERWGRVGAIRAALSSGGLAFQSRCQPNALKDLAIEVRPHDVAVTPRRFRPPWMARGVDARARRHLRRQRAADRRAARSEAPFRRRRPAGLLGQARYPHLRRLRALELSLVSVPARRQGRGAHWRGGFFGGRRPKLDARFGPDVPTHSARQSFFIDAERRLVRHDYTAEPIGSWATGANLCLASEVVAGIRFYTRRKVFPRLGPRQDGRPVSHAGVDRARRCRASSLSSPREK